MKTTPELIKELKDNQVFVFGSNSLGFHGAGAAGFACRGSFSNWRSDKWFNKALKSPAGSPSRIGKWAVLGNPHGFQKGKEGMSYSIETIKRAGEKRSTPLKNIEEQIIKLINFANSHPQYEILVTKIGCQLAGYTEDEIAMIFWKLEIPENMYLPKEFQ